MDEPTLSPLTTPGRESNMLPIVLGVGFVLIVVGIIMFSLRGHPKAKPTINPYAANLKLSDIKMSTAQNFVGSTVTYIDGTVSNSGDKTVTRVVVHIVFRDSMGQVAQAEDLPLKVLQNTGPYLDTADLSSSPLGPGQSKQSRLVFEHVSSEWNQAYPEIQIIDLTAK